MKRAYDIDLMEVGRRIRSVREILLLSQQDFAELCGLSTSFLSSVERGKKGIGIDSLSKICRVGQISSDYIIYGSSAKNSNVDTLIEMFRHVNDRDVEHITNILREYLLTSPIIEKKQRYPET